MSRDYDIWADFHTIERERFLIAWLRYAETSHGRDPQPGERLIVGDFEGLRCEGTMTRRLANDLVEIELDLATMTGA